jgi:hypothetical protein
LLMLLMHPVGKVYSVIALVMAVAAHLDFRPRLPTLLPYAAAALLIAAATVIPLLVDQPVLRVDPEPMPAGFTMLDGLLANLWRAVKVITSGYGRGPVIGIPLALGVYWLAWRGYKSAPAATRWHVSTAFLLLAGMCAILLAHVLPHYPAEAFGRAWIALATAIAGAAAFALVGPDGILVRQAPSSGRPWRDPAIRSLAFLGVFGISGAVVLAQQALKIRDRHYQTFEPDQVRLLVERCGTAVHADETAILFYLSHGADACPSLYLPALKGESGRAARLAGLPQPLLLVAAKPGPREIAISRQHPATLTIGEAGARSLHLNLVASSPEAMLRVRVASAGREQVRDVAPSQTAGLVAVELPAGSDVTTVMLEVPSGSPEVDLEGMHLDADAQGWPWNRNVSLSHFNGVYAFSAPDLTAGLFSSLEVIDSRGSTLLAKLGAPN